MKAIQESKAIRNSYPLWREAKVINTTDLQKLGRIQLKVYPELSDIPDADCPWCFPHTGGVHGKSFGVPLLNQLITCVVWNRYWNEITFLPFNITKPTEHLFSNWKKDQKPKITDMKDDPEEEHMVVEEYEDGFTEFHDTKNSQHGFLHPAGTFATINKDGDVFFQSVKNFTFHNKDSDLLVTADAETGDVNFETKGNCESNIGSKQTTEVKGDITLTGKANWTVNITGNTEIKTNGNTKIESTGNLDLKSSGPCKIESSAKMDIKASGPVTVESSAMTTVKGSSMVVVDAPILNFKGNKSMGTVPPSGSGCLCALAVCPAAGIPQVG